MENKELNTAGDGSGLAYVRRLIQQGALDRAFEYLQRARLAAHDRDHLALLESNYRSARQKFSQQLITAAEFELTTSRSARGLLDLLAELSTDAAAPLPPSRRRWRPALAAALLIVVALSGFWGWQHRKNDAGRPSTSENKTSGAQSPIIQGDNTKIIFNNPGAAPAAQDSLEK